MSSENSQIALDMNHLQKIRRAAYYGKLDENGIANLQKLLELRQMVAQELRIDSSQNVHKHLESNYDYIQNQIKLLLNL